MKAVVMMENLFIVQYSPEVERFQRVGEYFTAYPQLRHAHAGSTLKYA
jgi:hypothetical protein